MAFRKREDKLSSLSDLFLEEAMKLLTDSPGDDDKLHLHCLTQHNFNAKCYRHVCATCFGVYFSTLRHVNTKS